MPSTTCLQPSKHADCPTICGLPSSNPSTIEENSHSNLNTRADVDILHRHTTLSTSLNLHCNIPNEYALLNLCCFNVRVIVSNSPYLVSLLNDFDIKFIAISEHWLHDYNLNRIQQISDEYTILAKSPPQQEDPVYCVPRLIRGHRGVALGWHKSLDRLISPLPFVSSCKMVGIEYNPSHHSLYLISVYLPSRSGCTDEFKESLDQLDAAILLLPSGADIVIMGDFNADLGNLGGPGSCTE